MSAVSFYNRISGLYPFIDFFLKSHKKELVKEVNLLPTGKLLEVGVGTAHYLRHYKEHEISAIDSSEQIIKKAKKNVSQHVKLIEMKAEEMSFADSSFNIVVLSHLLSISRQPNVILEQSVRILKKEGHIIILNHFTSNNPIAVFDYLFHPIAKLFYFNSYFKLSSLTVLDQLKLKKELRFGTFKQYRLLVLQKV